MKNLLIRLVKTGVALLVLFIVGWIGVSLFPKKAIAPQPRLTVAATIFPLYDMARFIGGEYVDAKLLLTGAEPLGDLNNVAQANFTEVRVIFAAGHGLDTDGVSEEHRVKLFTPDRGVDLLLEQGATASPYYWLSVKQAPRIAENIANKLTELDPAHASYYQERLELLHTQLRALDANIETLFKEAPRKFLAVYGYDWEYFARDYGLDIVYFHPAVAEPALPETETAAFTNAIDRYTLSRVFSDISLSPQPISFLLQRPGFALLNLDALGGVEDRQSYLATMAYNARTIFEGLHP